MSTGRAATVAAVIALAAVMACRSHTPAAESPTGVGPDSARGVVAVVGSEPRVTVIVTPIGAPDAFAPRGADATLLRGLPGLEVTLFGRRSADRVVDAGPRGAQAFDMQQFVVRAADGHPVTDGVLGSEQGMFFLTTAGGARVAIATLPPALASQVGARVYLVGSLDAPMAYGVIRAAR